MQYNGLYVFMDLIGRTGLWEVAKDDGIPTNFLLRMTATTSALGGVVQNGWGSLDFVVRVSQTDVANERLGFRVWCSKYQTYALQR
jgi:hypothetical protein